MILKNAVVFVPFLVLGIMKNMKNQGPPFLVHQI